MSYRLNLTACVVYHLVRKTGWSKVAPSEWDASKSLMEISMGCACSFPLNIQNIHFPEGQIQAERPRISSLEQNNRMYVFRLEIPFGNSGLPFKKSRFLRKFSLWEDHTSLSDRNFRIFWVDGKQTVCCLVAYFRAMKYPIRIEDGFRKPIQDHK